MISDSNLNLKLLFNLLLVCLLFRTQDHNDGTTMTRNYYKHATLNVQLILFSINTQHEKMIRKIVRIIICTSSLP